MPASELRTRILNDALRARKGEAFEKALGRAVRHHGGSYAEYVAIIAEVREYARSHEIDLREAARAISRQL